MKRKRSVIVMLAGLGLLGPLAGTAAADEPPTALSGTVTARFTGQPVPGACVSVIDDQQAELARGCADDAGNYSIKAALPGTYFRVKTTAPGYADTWVRNSLIRDARDFATAEPQPLDGRRLDLGLRPPGVGAIRGQLTYDGAPVPNGRVTIVDVDGSLWGKEVDTDQTGHYTFGDLWPGHYQLQYVSDSGTQYYHQKDSLGGADKIVVADGPDTIVDEQVYPPGTIEVTATDSTNGKPVSHFCVFAPGTGLNPTCTDNGTAEVRIYVGTHDLSISGDPTYFGGDIRGVVVKSGEVTKATVKLDPAMAIRTTVRDAKTGRPVPNTCIQPVDVTAPAVSRWNNDWQRWCSDEQGVVTASSLPIATYRLLVRPRDGVHGLQWAGRTGGTGDQEQARKIGPAPGTITTVPDIRLDLAGTVSGTVTDEAGQPLGQACVNAYPTDSSYSDFCTDPQGHYQVTGLGPYAWPLEFTDMSGQHGWRWSGNADNRFAAKPAKVKAGADVKADETLQPAAHVTGSGSAAGADDFVNVLAYNAITGDFAGGEFAFPDYTLTVGAQCLKLRFLDVLTKKSEWYLDAASARTARPVEVKPGQTVSGIDQIIH